MSHINGTILKELRKSNSLTQQDVADSLQVGRTTYTKIENGIQEIDSETLSKLSRIFNVSTDFLLGNEPLQNHKPKSGKIPVLGSIVANTPIEAVTEILDYEEIPEEMAQSGKYFALKIKGNSMAPRICDGDVVIACKQEIVENNEIAVVLINGEDATIKEVQFSKTGITLVGWNVSEYKPHFYPTDEIKSLPVKIIGKVVELRGKF